MSWPPISLVGFVVFITLLLIRFLVAFHRLENLDVGVIFRFVYTCFGTMMAISSSLVATYFVVFGVPYPGKSMEDLQLIIFIAAVLIFSGGIYYYFADMRVSQRELNNTRALEKAVTLTLII